MFNLIYENLSLSHCILLFPLFCMGWLLENSYSFITTREFIKPNFLWGPLKPMYGVAPLLLIFLLQQEMHWSFLLFLCFFIPSLVEYITGLLSEKLFQKKWWDYSHFPLQLHGHYVCTFLYPGYYCP